MVIDTSAVIAIVREEPGFEALEEALTRADESLMSAGSFVELAVVSQRTLSAADAARAQRLVESYDIEIVPLDGDQVRIAAHGHLRFGRGSGHPARLNFGDCFSYALAIARDEPLLFIGDNFGHTDVRVALR